MTRSALIDLAGTGLPQAVAATLVTVRKVKAFDVEAGAIEEAFDVERHHPLGDKLDRLLEQISICPLLNQLGQRDSGLGHRGFSGECWVFANSTVAKNRDDHPLSPAGRIWLSQLHHFRGHADVLIVRLPTSLVHSMANVNSFIRRHAQIPRADRSASSEIDELATIAARAGQAEHQSPLFRAPLELVRWGALKLLATSLRC